MPLIDTANIGVRFYLNGFPKAGLHLLDLLVRPLVAPMPTDNFIAPWVGMFQGNSWTFNAHPTQKITHRLGRVHDGHFLKGHMGYNYFIERFMYWQGMTHLFIYRDLRDVAVSQTHHILSVDDYGNSHPGKDLYRALGGFDEVLSAVIVGLGEYPGVLSRWDYYKGWLDVDWILPIPFELARQNIHTVAESIVLHMLKRMGRILGVKTAVDGPDLDKIAAAMVITANQVELSPTFRKGRVGDWKERFKPIHVEQFKEQDTENQLARLGYEQDRNWGV